MPECMSKDCQRPATVCFCDGCASRIGLRLSPARERVCGEEKADVLKGFIIFVVVAVILLALSLVADRIFHRELVETPLVTNPVVSSKSHLALHKLPPVKESEIVPGADEPEREPSPASKETGRGE